MAEIKKTIENPPSRLVKKIISLSEADNWEEAKKEWEMKEYYYVSEYHSCLCSSREVHNITVIENIHNSNRMDICNSCANLYFGIVKSLKIESIVRRLKKDIGLNMDDVCLVYLLENRIIDTLEYKNYNLVRLSRKDEYNRFYREKINRQLVHFVDYTNKSFFEKIETLIAWSTGIGNQHYVSVFVKLIKNLLDTGQPDVAYLDSFIEEHGIELLPLAREDKNLVLETIGEHKRNTLDLEEYVRTSKRRLTKDSTEHVLSPFCIEGLEEADLSEIIRHEETEEEYEALERFKQALRISGEDNYPMKNRNSENDSFDEHQARMDELMREGLARQEAERKAKEKKKEKEQQQLMNKKKMREERKITKLSQGNFEFVYHHGSDPLKLEHFCENVISPIEKNVLEALSSFIYAWFMDVKSSGALRSFIYYLTNTRLAHKFGLIPYNREFTEVMYVCALLQLIEIDELGGILKDLYKDTNDDVKRHKIAMLNEILAKASYAVVLKNNDFSLITKNEI